MNSKSSPGRLSEDLERNVAVHDLLNDATLSRSDERDARAVLGLVTELGTEIDFGADERIQEMADLRASVFATVVADRFFRPASRRAMLEEFLEVLDTTGVPGMLGDLDQLGLRLLQNEAEAAEKYNVFWAFAQIATRAIEKHTLNKLSKYILFDKTGEPKSVMKSIAKQTRKTKIGAETNYVIESAISEAEATKNTDWYIDMIELGAEALAIKPTAIIPLADGPIASEHHEKALTEQLVKILESVRDNKDPETGRYTHITLDMESTGTFDWTVNAFIAATKRVPEVSAGIALQSYMPDSFEAAQKIAEECQAREAAGHPELWVRLVKGANIASEEYDAMAHGRIREDGKADIAMFDNKYETDAHYMAMFEELVSKGVGVVIGSMNDITIIHCLMTAERLIKDPAKKRRVILSMLKGLGGAKLFPIIRRRYEIQSRIYTPVIARKELVEVLAYFLRRGDELYGVRNGVRNYKGETATELIGSKKWVQSQGGVYVQALDEKSKRTYPLENRIRGYRGGNQPPIVRIDSIDQYRATPDANFASKEDRKWAKSIIEQCNNLTDEDAQVIAAMLSNGESGGEAVDYHSLTKPDLVLSKVKYASESDADLAVENARDNKEWASESFSERRDTIFKATQSISSSRDEFMKAIMLDTDKTVGQADTEITEAIDLGRLQDIHTATIMNRGEVLNPKGNGVSTVICPWNFSVAISYQHIIANLVAGNRVIVKPAPASIHATYLLCEKLWAAGIPRSALQFLPCEDDVAAHLAANKDISHIGFTGSTGVAQKIRRANPNADFIGEAGGVNVLTITGKTDLKEAAKEVMLKGMGFAGQKCSAIAYILITDDADYAKFIGYLEELAGSLNVSNALDLSADYGSLIRPLEEDGKTADLHAAMTTCEEGEWWIKKPEMVDGDPAKWTVGIKGVSIHKKPANTWKEGFAPFVCVGRVPDIETAARLQVETGFGLTGGIMTSSVKDQKRMMQMVKVGSFYVCKGIVGARAGYEDFGGGYGLSRIGMHGVKTGTEEFLIAHGEVEVERVQIHSMPANINEEHRDQVAQLASFAKIAATFGLNKRQIVNTVKGYFAEVDSYHSKRHHAPIKLSCEENYREFVPSGTQVVRIDGNYDAGDALMYVYASIAAGNRIVVSLDAKSLDDVDNVMLMHLLSHLNIEIEEHSDQEFLEYIDEVEDLSCVHGASNEPVQRKMIERNTYLNTRRPSGSPRADLILQHNQRTTVNHTGRFGDEGLNKLDTLEEVA